MIRYDVHNRFHIKIGEYATMKKAYEAAIQYLNDLIVELTSGSYYTKHIEEERDSLIELRNKIGTKYQPKPDKFYLGHDVSIIPIRKE